MKRVIKLSLWAKIALSLLLIFSFNTAHAQTVEKLNNDIKQLCTILDEAPEKHKKASEKDCMAELEALQHRLTLRGSKTAAIQLYKMGLWGLELLLQKPVFGYRLALDGLRQKAELFVTANRPANVAEDVDDVAWAGRPVAVSDDDVEIAFLHEQNRRCSS